MRSTNIGVLAGAALMFGLVPARTMPAATLAGGADAVHIIPVAQGCGPGA